jgi:hypothetical protein
MSNRPLTRTRTRVTERLISTRRVQLALGILLIFLFIVAGYTVLEPYTGFGKRELWDWLTLGVVSAAIFLVGLLFSRRQREQQEAVSREHEQDAALTAYLDQMSNLMIDQQLGRERIAKDALEDNVRKVAQARTIAVLLGLDKEHKRRPLKLVYELGLLKKPHPVLELKNAGLDGANLSELTLRNACLNGADLRHADLHGADLEGSNLRDADLRGADLAGADLSGVDLRNANLLPYDETNPTAWNRHNLEKRNTLNNRNSFSREGLVFTNLSGAILVGADLSDAYLNQAKITKEQLEQVKSLEGATMPNGQMYENWLQGKGREEYRENSGS